MQAHILNADGVILRTVIVPSLDFMPGLIDASIGGHPGDRMLNGAIIIEPQKGPSREQLKAQRQAAVDAITVTVNGKVFDGDEISQERMTRALKAADITGQTSCTWVLSDNSAVTVTRQELEQALALSIQSQAAIWVIQV